MIKVAKSLCAETCGCGEHILIVMETPDGEIIKAPLKLDAADKYRADIGYLIEQSRLGGGVPMGRKH